MNRLLLSLLTLGVVCSLKAADAPSKKARPRQVIPDTIEKSEITIWSNGTRMVGDLYQPKERKDGDKLPAIIFCNGTGGTRQGATRFCIAAATNGFIALGFDYRGWGASESPLMTLEKQPKPDEKNEMDVKVRALRWQMNYADQTDDIRAAISYVAGEPSVDWKRIGLLGTSYGGGLVTWVAGNDPRVKCVAAQVPGMGGGRGPQAEIAAYKLATAQARGDTEPVPVETGKLGGKLAAYPQMRVNPARNIGYSAIEAAEKIKVPMLIIDAEKEELMDNKQNGQKVAEILKAKGTMTKYHVQPGISHYGVYGEAFAEVTKMEMEWFKTHLMDPAAQP